MKTLYSVEIHKETSRSDLYDIETIGLFEDKETAQVILETVRLARSKLTAWEKGAGEEEFYIFEYKKFTSVDDYDNNKS